MVDEVPTKPKAGQTAVGFAIRYSLPVFFSKPGEEADIGWSASISKGQLVLKAANAGGRHVRLAGLKVVGANGKAVSFGNGLSGMFWVSHLAFGQPSRRPSHPAPRSRSLPRATRVPSKPLRPCSEFLKPLSGLLLALLLACGPHPAAAQDQDPLIEEQEAAVEEQDSGISEQEPATPALEPAEQETIATKQEPAASEQESAAQVPEPADHETVAVKQEPAAPEQESAAQVPEPADHETVAVKQEPAASEPEPADQETVALQQEPAMDGQAHADLQLEVKVNGYPLNAIGAFALLPDGRIGSPRSELREIGVAVPDGNPEDIIPLDSIAGLSYVYDEENQVIDLEISEAVRRPKELDAAQLKGDLEPTASYGMVLNYTAFGAASYNIEEDLAAINGGSLNLDARAFSPFGTLRQTGIVGTTTFSDFDALRLDTSWTYSDEKRALTAQLGDIVSGGLSWTRPVRLGGAQIRRNFRVRPDLITMPVPVVEGSARVPSTLDVYIDGMKAYSGALQEGPFRVDNLPVYTQDGTMRVVLTDATGARWFRSRSSSPHLTC